MDAERKMDASSADAAAVTTPSLEDAAYGFDEEVLKEVRNNKVWMQDPKYFKKVIISPSATMKMMNHANSGVEKGIKNGGKPVEIMGLILGRPSTGTDRDAGDAQTLIVTDCFPLPIEGAETRVLADDAEVINYMISLGEAIEQTRKEKFMGWYHSHPFDVEVHSHCFLSATDVSTQLQWQRSEDPHGNPWLAIVLDPLRSLAKKRPEMGAFRVYPPEFAAPVNETPDGTIITDETTRMERWGSCWNRYYTLECDYFMSSLGSQVVSILSEEFLWMRTLSSNTMQERENRDRFSERIQLLANKLDSAEMLLAPRGSRSSRIGEYYVPEKQPKESEDSVLNKITQAANELSIEHSHGQALQIAKKALFNDKF
ncbi:Cop9 signalosome complex subunit 5 [Globisporangium polare]